MALLAEEFLELMNATFTDPANADGNGWGEDLCEKLFDVINNAGVAIYLPEFVDAIADMNYVNEGTLLAFGVDGESVMAEVQRANMDKDPAYVEAKNAHHEDATSTIKPVKPEGWKAPDIAGVLRKQGWTG